MRVFNASFVIPILPPSLCKTFRWPAHCFGNAVQTTSFQPVVNIAVVSGSAHLAIAVQSSTSTMKEAHMPALRDPNRKGVAGSFTNAVGGRRHIARAVDGTSHVDRVSSSLR